MEFKVQFNRCCNPLKIENHIISEGLRIATISLQKSLNLSRFDYVCGSCRKKLGSIKSVASTSTNLSRKSDVSDNACVAEDDNIFVVDNPDIHDIVVDKNVEDDTRTDNFNINESISTRSSFSSGIFISYCSFYI